MWPSLDLLMRVRFSEFVLDLASRQVRRGSDAIHLSPKAFQLLAELVACRPRALSKADLQERLWPGIFVAEANVANLVGEVRTALGDDPRHPRFVRTLHRYGYAFCADAKEHVSGSRSRSAGGTTKCRLTWSGGRVTLTEGEHLLGRSPDLDVYVNAPSVSRRHARIGVSAKEVTLEDRGSTQGTYLRGVWQAAKAQLEDGDELRLGSVRLKFRVVGGEGSTDTASRGSRA
jgi:DNA-binding winged helix-turn-helix (wHTH) protein